MGSTTPKDDTLPYWQVNVAPSKRQTECPLALQNISAKDITILSTPDTSYKILTWPTVQQTITTNNIDHFQRLPSQLRRYHFFAHKIRRQYGSVLDYIIKERVCWGGEGEGDMIPKGKRAFENMNDFKILWNDWPYGIDTKIIHLVVWTKFELIDDPNTGDLTDEARGEIDEFVDRVFGDVCGFENVVWFKNWAKLKSVKGLEHFHVMLFDPDLAFVDRVTGGDQPLSRVILDEEV